MFHATYFYAFDVQEAVTVANEEVTKGKEKKKKKKNTMTLEEFNQLPPEKPKGSDSGEFLVDPLLTHWGRDKMTTILQTTFSSAFSWMKM